MRCPVCHSDAVSALLEARALPAHAAARYVSAESARACPRGDLALRLCARCAYVWNADYDPARTAYAEGYDASLHHSPRYAAFLDDTAARLARRQSLQGRRVVEAGCGDGAFLARLAARTGCDALGIDPSAPAVPPEGVRVLREPLGARHAGLGAALGLCRHALHYLPDPVGFLRLLGRAAETVYVEVPNAAHVFASGVPWIVFYEHVGYFGAPALRQACARAGLCVTEAAPCYAEGQYLYALAASVDDTLHAGAAEPLPEQDAPEIAALADAARAFAAAYASRIAAARDALAAHAGRRVVLWGAAGRGATFLAHCDPEATRVQAVTDSNPARHGSFVPGTGHPIVAPEALTALAPDVLVLTNNTYAAEITAQARALGLSADVLVL